MHQNRYAPRLARLYRARGGHPAFAAGQSDLRAALSDDRARLCGRKGKTRDALYTLSRADRSNRMGQAQICCDESQETCHPQVATFLPLPVFFMLEAPLLHCNGASLTDCAGTTAVVPARFVSHLRVANRLRRLCPLGDGELFKFYLKSSVCQRQTGLPKGNPPCTFPTVPAGGIGRRKGARIQWMQLPKAASD